MYRRVRLSFASPEVVREKFSVSQSVVACTSSRTGLELLNMRIILTSFIVFISAAVLASEGEQKGSLYISKIDPNVSWEGNPTGAKPDSVFTIVLDGKIKVRISKDDDAKIENLELGGKHSLESHSFLPDPYGFCGPYTTFPQAV